VASAIRTPLIFQSTFYSPIIVKEMKHTVRELEMQMESIFVEGKSREEALPYLETMISLQAGDL
jgi:hypothetical protein